MAFTVKRALEAIARFNGSSGTCWDDPSNLVMLNEVRELIYSRKDSRGTMQWMLIQSRNGYFYLPDSIETIRQAWMCHGEAEIRNRWFLNVNRSIASTLHHPGVIQVMDMGVRKPYNATVCGQFTVELESETDEDDGVEVTVEVGGSSPTRETLILKSSDSPMMSTSSTELNFITKPVTKGRVLVWAILQDGCRVLICTIRRECEVPGHSLYKIIGNCGNRGKLTILGKKRFFNLIDHNEPCDIESVQALRFGAQAMAAQDRSDPAGYTGFVSLMDEALDEVDTNLNSNEPSSTIIPVYAQSSMPGEFYCH